MASPTIWPYSDCAHYWKGLALRMPRNIARRIFVVVTLRQMQVPHVCCVLCLCFLPLQDMRKSGCSLAAILAAGQWKSSAFMKYLDESTLEKDLAYQIAIESEPEEWID